TLKGLSPVQYRTQSLA
ncbi:IS3 family transposase, partial [Streptococcus equi]